MKARQINLTQAIRDNLWEEFHEGNFWPVLRQVLHGVTWEIKHSSHISIHDHPAVADNAPCWVLLADGHIESYGDLMELLEL